MSSFLPTVSKLYCLFIICGLGWFGEYSEIIRGAGAESSVPLVAHLTVFNFPNSLNQSDGASGKSISDSEVAKAVYKSVNQLSQSNLDKSSNHSEETDLLPKGTGKIDYDKWEAPEFIQKNYPYYHAGFDDEDRPVWVFELGKFQTRKVIDQGEEALADMETYFEQAFFRMYKSIHERNEEKQLESPVRNVVFLVDFDGLELHRIAHLPTMTYLLSIARRHQHQINDLAGATIIINVNYAAEIFLNAMRPFFGRTFENTSIYGTNKAKWIPHLRKFIPVKSIPPWYGGSQDFKPVAIYG